MICHDAYVMFNSILSHKPVSIDVQLPVMHQALFVLEILLDIISAPSLPRKSIAALARTCKTFHEPAMDALWAHMYGIDPLLGCVTRLHPMVYPRATLKWPRQLDVTKPLSEHEAREFLRHSARVRSFLIRTEDHFRLLTALPFNSCVFPRLRKLDWSPSTSVGLHLFLSPTLRHCSLHDWVSLVPSDLKSIAPSCPILENLTLWSDLSFYEQSLLSEVICSYKGLKHLTCPSFDSAAWQHLSNLHTLETVTVTKGDLELDEVLLNGDNIRFGPFLNVTTLSFIDVKSALGIITAIQHSFPSLQQFEMSVDVLPWAEAEQLFHALTQCNASHTIEDIIISSKFRSTDPHKSLTVIRQLLCFPRLRTLRLTIDLPIYLDDDLFLQAMSCWPNIQHLHLDSLSHSPPVTFRGLFAALPLCPHLQELKICIDVRSVDIAPTPDSFQHTSLQTLDMCYSSHVADAESVAHTIFSKLPSVDYLNFQGEAWLSGRSQLDRRDRLWARYDSSRSNGSNL